VVAAVVEGPVVVMAVADPVADMAVDGLVVAVDTGAAEIVVVEDMAVVITGVN
jgi:hypothetical protein